MGGGGTIGGISGGRGCLRRGIGRGSPSRRFVGTRPGLDRIVIFFVEWARQHQWGTQLVEKKPLLVLVEEEYIEDELSVEEAPSRPNVCSQHVCPPQIPLMVPPRSSEHFTGATVPVRPST